MARIDAYHVILAGGSGTRFWPVSRRDRPKQLLPLAGERPLAAQAYDRAAAMSGPDRVFVCAGREHVPGVMAAVPGLSQDRIIAEPRGRNTAPSVALSALWIARRDPSAVLIVAPADHVYRDPGSLERALERAVAAARGSGALVTVGITPTRPETGYGYIRAGGQAQGAPEGVLRAERFVEKPDEAAARRYLDERIYLWNSGLFVWTARSILDALAACAPDVWEAIQPIRAALGGPEERRVIEEAFARVPSISIDYAVLERAPDVLVVPADPGWDDVGSWDAVAAMDGGDEAGNTVRGDAGAILLQGASDCFVQADGGRAVALVGVKELIVVDAGDALLICRKGDSQQVRRIVDMLRARGREDLV